ncbi:flavin dependent monooxygenase-like protein [Mollisia scopiformis]|uniref:Flavin dependent monooxygenase-like protein n=1 Tax=Mollisia scopiformis TaxID=149040 RepID=A0A194XB00_MOLSC|nr:flavin dependent monooxygenase-like protein [Mollisia scopiformis]KUJ17319.1 flavin dependent monooxygenase-like protein [Mollisia scopiformis]
MGSVLRPNGPFNVKRIAVIGAGPTGLAAAKYLVAERVFDTVDIYEQQAEVGGVWNYTPSLAERVPVPQTSPHVSPAKPVWPKDAAAPIFSNPMYERLNTNIPKNLMQFSDLDFPSESLLYPSRQDVQKYLIKYSQDIRHLINFSTQVEDIKLTRVDDQDHWTLVAKSTVTEEESCKEYDAIVVSNGHYSVPWIPDVPGVKEFGTTYPSVISHSKIYRSPASYAGKKVIVVGNAASGLDIGNQISAVCKTPLLNSVREPAELPIGVDTKEEVPTIAEFLIDDRGVRFEDGRVEKDVDAIIYCTGYLYSYPFMKSLEPPLVATGRRTIGLWQQVFNIAHPTLAFTALSQKIIPFPLSEAQGAAIAKVWSNNISLLTTEEMEAWERSRVDELGEGTAFHVYGYPKDAEYINYLHDWVMTAENGFSKEPPFWDERKRWLRSIYIDVKKRFNETGGKATTLEELGFHFEEYS